MSNRLIFTILFSFAFLCANQPYTLQQLPTNAHSIYLPLVRSGKPAWWKPRPQDRLQLQFTDLPIDQSVVADVYDIDMFDTPVDVVRAFHLKGRRVLCYINVGAWEEWRPDKDAYPPAVLGNDYAGWPGEKWLDIRRLDVLAPLLQARFDQCKAKGFDGIEPDNINGYLNDTGFPLSYQDQITYNRWLAQEAHQRGLAIGLKNDTEQAGDLVDAFDFAVTEDCLVEGWCAEATVFVEQAKPVFAVEYTDKVATQQFLKELCLQAQALKLNAVLKHRTLDAWYQPCP